MTTTRDMLGWVAPTAFITNDLDTERADVCQGLVSMEGSRTTISRTNDMGTGAPGCIQRIHRPCWWSAASPLCALTYNNTIPAPS